MEELQNWLEDLLNLQETDSRLDRMKTLVADAPKQKKDAQDNLDAQQAAALAAKEEVRKVELEIKGFAAVIDSIDKRRLKLLEQSSSVKDNSTYRALLHEADSLQEQISDKETEELEVMEILDAKKAEFLGCKGKLEEAIGRVEQMMTDLDVRVKNCQAQMSTLEEKRSKEASLIDDEILSRYERIRVKKSTAIVELNEDKCGNCHLKLTTQEVKLAKNRVAHTSCGNCGVLIYR